MCIKGRRREGTISERKTARREGEKGDGAGWGKKRGNTERR